VVERKGVGVGVGERVYWAVGVRGVWRRRRKRWRRLKCL
jgi:hypothetical protein